eukprot:TRINITY_DN4141_c0_g1_i1.p1 TRINITY_DN4141_c0_g1~~TRINITY_DN4141_c0_g1_i1.p1  ORF type:complete len:170 (-),score=75.24 TRINITY_DN4141_c0_g1_i1:10-519(-)
MPNGKGVVGGYVHRVQGTPEHGVTLGAMGALVALEGEVTAANQTQMADFGNRLATHIIGFKPEVVSRSDITPELWSQFKEKYLKKQEDLTGKRPNIPQKQFEDKISSDIALLEQEGMNDKKITETIAEQSKALKTPITVKTFTKFICGEGIEKKEVNFAEEVAKMAQNK